MSESTPPESTSNPAPKTARWRTVIATLALAGMALAGMILSLRHGSDFAVKLYADFTGALVILGVGLQTKALGQHLGATGGVRGAAAALLNPTPPPPAAPPPQ